MWVSGIIIEEVTQHNQEACGQRKRQEGRTYPLRIMLCVVNLTL